MAATSSRTSELRDGVPLCRHLEAEEPGLLWSQYCLARCSCDISLQRLSESSIVGLICRFGAQRNHGITPHLGGAPISRVVPVTASGQIGCRFWNCVNFCQSALMAWRVRGSIRLGFPSLSARKGWSKEGMPSQASSRCSHHLVNAATFLGIVNSAKPQFRHN